MLTPVYDAIHVIIATIVLAITPPGAAYSYERPNPNIQISPTAQSGQVPTR